MNAKTAWSLSAKAFEASRHERLPRLVRAAACRLGVALFWTALALEGRALEVWRDLRAHKAAVPRQHIAAVCERCLELWSGLVDRLNDALWRRANAECPLVPAWSLPDSRKIRGLG